MAMIAKARFRDGLPDPIQGAGLGSSAKFPIVVVREKRHRRRWGTWSGGFLLPMRSSRTDCAIYGLRVLR
ncbi:hypothetical protein HDV63DRAFT_360611 [Trichoderma sp. SZMC 28014]